jgi:hypothetical protein
MIQLFRAGSLVFSLGLGIATTASAHHSAAMFDAQKTETIVGTVKEFQYTQPHCWLVVVVPGQNGGEAQEWRIEAGAPTLLLRMGIEKSTFPVGDKVTVHFHPLKDGRSAGEFLSATLSNGKEIGMFFGPPPPGAGGPPPGGGGPPPGPGTPPP